MLVLSCWTARSILSNSIKVLDAYLEDRLQGYLMEVLGLDRAIQQTDLQSKKQVKQS